MYIPLKIETLETAGFSSAKQAVRLPHLGKNLKRGDGEVARALIKMGDDHAKAFRGCMVWYKMECQVGWLLEYLTYRVGIECLSSSSSMHSELRGLSGEELATQKQQDLLDKVYTRIEMASYQSLRRIYISRKGHRHPDWKLYREWIESLSLFNELIYPEGEIL